MLARRVISGVLRHQRCSKRVVSRPTKNSETKRFLGTTSFLALKEVTLTSERYPNLQRGGFSQLTPDDVSNFKAILDESRVLTEDLEGNLTFSALLLMRYYR